MSKWRVALMLPVIAIGIQVCTGAYAGPASESDRAQVEALEHRWLAAIRSGHREALKNILADDFIDINVNGQARDRATAIAHSAAPPDATQNITQMRVRVHGDAAIATGINTVHSTARSWTVEVAFTDVFIRTRDGWRAVSAQETLRKPVRR